MRRDLRVARYTSVYQELKTAYQKEIRKAKRERWNNFLDGCNTMSNSRKLAHIITKLKELAPGITIKSDGTPTLSNLSSIKNITRTLFSASFTKPIEPR
jgi:hypothetical protein